MSVKVKKLDWREWKTTSGTHEYTALTLWCRYRVWYSGPYQWIVDQTMGGGMTNELGDEIETAEEAKSCAQRHYEKWVMDNIEITEEEVK